MAGWCSIFCATDDRDGLIARVRAEIAGARFTLYDPFALLPGASYPITLRLFAAPTAPGVRAAWVRLIADENSADLARLAAALAAEVPTHLLDLAQFPDETDTPDGTAGGRIGGVDLAVLPDAAQRMAARVDLSRAGNMMDGLLGGLTARLGASEADAAAARDLLSPRAVDWSRGAGARLTAAAAQLGLPKSWQSPDFAALRDAYAVHKRLERMPNARLYPGDAEARDSVPDALRYTPIFAGRHP